MYREYSDTLGHGERREITVKTVLPSMNSTVSSVEAPEVSIARDLDFYRAFYFTHLSCTGVVLDGVGGIISSGCSL